MDWALSVAHGEDWHGHEVGQGSVIYVAAEDGAGLKFRTRAWREDHGTQGKGQIEYYIEPVNLSVTTQVEWLAERVREADAHFLIIDTYAKCSVGTEENSATDTGLVVEQLYRLRDTIEDNGTTVLLIHHTGYDIRRARGSSALVSDVDFAFNMEAPEDAHTATELKAKKRKDGALPSPMTFRLEQIDVGGKTSCVLRETTAVIKQNAVSRVREQLLTTPKPVSPKELEEATGLSQRSVSDALAKLQEVNQAKQVRSQSGRSPALWVIVSRV